MAERTVLDLYRHDFDAPRAEHYAHWTPDGRRTLSTEEFFRSTSSLAESLSDLGVTPGDRVMLVSDDRPEWHIVDLAVLDLGAVDVPVYGTLTPEQVAYQVNDSGSRVAVTENPEQSAKFLAIRDRCPTLEHLIQIEGPREDGVFALDDLTVDPGDGAEQRFWDRAAALDERSLATIVYTSGTTGDPKGVMLSHQNFVQNALHIFRRIKGDRTDLVLEFLPLCHAAERTAGYCYMLSSTSKAYCSVQHVGELIARIRPTVFLAVPRVYEKVYQKIFERVDASSPLKRSLFNWALGVGRQVAGERVAGRAFGGLLGLQYPLADRLVLSKIRAGFGGRVRFCVTGAADTPRHVLEFFHAIGIWMVEAYGLTETSAVVSIGGTEPGSLRLGCVGRPLDNVDVRLAPDGELTVKGPSITTGYWNKPEATAEVFDGEGFFHTGDIGEIDDDGFIKFIDRKKDLIVTSGGKNVAPQPIESQLKRSQLVDSVVVLGDRRRFVSALFSPNLEELQRWADAHGVSYTGPSDLTTDPSILEAFQQIVDSTNARLARYEQVRKFAVLPVTLSVEGGHLTPTLKVKRRIVEQDFADIIERMYTA
jgi:long-chain acyl-CoA synthetase